jgi:hypothetical protein
MYRIPGQITTRLLADPDLTVDGWYPTREASLRTSTRPAAVGYRVTGRKIQRRRRHAALMQAAMIAVLAGAGLVLYAGAEQYADHRYDGGPDRKASPFCHVDQPAEGPRCYGVDRIGDLP